MVCKGGVGAGGLGESCLVYAGRSQTVRSMHAFFLARARSWLLTWPTPFRAPEAAPSARPVCSQEVLPQCQSLVGQIAHLEGAKMQGSFNENVSHHNVLYGPMTDQMASPDIIDNSDRPPRTLYVLTGLVGSGKSTFADWLCRHFPVHHERASQDELGSRQAVESFVLSRLSTGVEVIVDRTNIDAKQRSHWLRVAKECQDLYGVPVEVYCIFFDTPYDECKARLTLRKGHETLRTPLEAIKVLDIFSKQLVPPSENEGFHKIITVGPDWNTEPYLATRDEVGGILKLVHDAPYVGGLAEDEPTRGPTLSAGTPRAPSKRTQQRPRPGRGSLNHRNLPPRGSTDRVAPAPQAWQGPPPWALQVRPPWALQAPPPAWQDTYRSHPHQTYDQGHPPMYPGQLQYAPFLQPNIQHGGDPQTWPQVAPPVPGHFDNTAAPYQYPSQNDPGWQPHPS